jgi:hypothetical protein
MKFNNRLIVSLFQLQAFRQVVMACMPLHSIHPELASLCPESQRLTGFELTGA